MKSKDIKTASENVASKLALQRGRLRSFLFHRGGKKVTGVAVDHLLGLTEEALFDNGIVVDSDMLNGAVAQGVTTATRKILHKNLLTESWQARRDGNVSTNPIELTGYWKPIVSRRDNLKLPSEYKDFMQYQSNIAVRYNKDMVTALVAWQEKFGPDDKLVLSKRDLETINKVGYVVIYQPYYIACRVARIYQGTQGAGGYTNGKGVRYSTEFAEGRKVNGKQQAQFMTHIKAEYKYKKAHSKFLGDNTLANRTAFLRKYGNPGLLRACLELIYIAETKKSTMIIWQDVHTSLVCHIYAMLRRKNLRSIVDINHPKWFNRHDYYMNNMLSSSLDSAPFFRACTPGQRALFTKPSFVPFGHGAGADSCRYSVLNTDDMHWNAEAPTELRDTMSLNELVDAIRTGTKQVRIPEQFKLALRAAWPGWSKKKAITEDMYKDKLVIIFDDLKTVFAGSYNPLVRFNNRAVLVKEASDTIGKLPPSYTNRFGMKLVQTRWKRDPNSSRTIKNKTTLAGVTPTPLDVTFDKRVACTGSEFAVSMPHYKDAEMNVGIGNEFIQADKDCLSIHDAWGVRLEDMDFLIEVSARQFRYTHEEPMLNSMGYEVPATLPHLGDKFQIVR
jgi:hypothetical protein